MNILDLKLWGGRLKSAIFGTDGLIEFVRNKRRLVFLVKALAVLSVLAALSAAMPHMPAAWMMYAVWALMSTVCALGIAYPAVIRKTHRQVQFVEGSWIAKRNDGRTFRLIICFALAAVMMAGLLFESQKWEVWQWVFVYFSAPLYLMVWLLVEWGLKTQYKPLFQTKGTVLISNAITGFLMVVFFALILYTAPGEGISSITLAYLNVGQPFAESSSFIMEEIGKITACGNAATEVLATQAAGLSWLLAVVLRVSVFAAAFFGITSLFGLCLLSVGDFKKIFLPLQDLEGVRTKDSNRKFWYAFVLVLAPVVFAVGLTGLEGKLQEKHVPGEPTLAEQFVQDFVGVNVVVVDGKYYDAQSLKGVREEAQVRSENLANEARVELVPLIDASFATRSENVKDYAKWYFESASDQEYLRQQDAANPETFVKNQFLKHIEKDVDNSGLMDTFGAYAGQALELKADAERNLDACQVEDVPLWLQEDAVEVTPDFMAVDLEASQKIADAYAALTEGLEKDQIPDAVALKVADLAMKQKSSILLVEAVNTAQEGRPKNVFDMILDMFEPLANNMLNRSRCESEIKSCIEQERNALLAAFPDEPQKE